MRTLGLLSLLALAGWFLLSWVGSSILFMDHRLEDYPTPAAIGLDYEDVTLTAADGVPIAAWVVEPAGPARGTLLVVHGLHGHRQPAQVAAVVSAGLRALAIDLRGHGRSGQALTTFGWDERLDVRAAIDYAHERWPGQPLGAWGQSLGAAAIALAGDRAASLDAIVLEACYADIEDAWQTRIDTGFAPALRPLTGLTKALAEARLGDRVAHLRPAEALRSLPADRLLLVQGGDDPLVLAPEFHKLVAAAPGATVFLVPGAHHGDAFLVGGAAWRERLATFVLTRLSSRSRPRRRRRAEAA